MKQFEMDRTLIKIVAVTPVPEFKGEKRDHGVSVTFERNFENTILDEFDADLRPALYKAEDGKPLENADGQGEMTLPVRGVKLTARKCLSIQMPLKLRKDLAGWQVVYHRGASEASDIKAGDVKFSDFTLQDACQGGTVVLRFKAYQKLSPEVQGYVDHMAQTEVECTFRAPEKKQEDLVDQANKGSRKDKKKGAPKPSDPFHGSDLATDGSAPENAPEGEQASREGMAWPFPNPGQTHDEGEPPVEGEPEEIEE
jgi:hypothetical protein